MPTFLLRSPYNDIFKTDSSRECNRVTMLMNANDVVRTLPEHSNQVSYPFPTHEPDHSANRQKIDKSWKQFHYK